MEIQDMRELARLMQEFQLESLEVEKNGVTVKMKMPIPAGAAAACAAAGGGCAPATAEAPSAAPAGGSYEVASPMVGIFYAASTPQAKPFVKIGDKVKKGDVLCIIEAMKLMNEITAERDGRIVSVLAENGQVVEYGQPLFAME